MADYGQELQFGMFVTPSVAGMEHVVDLVRRSEAAGLDLVTFQDHPYQASFLDTWTLMSYLAGITSRIRIASNVIDLPLRPPAVLARSAASLDRLSGGRFELGLGAGAFWEAIEAMGGTRLTPGQSVDALREAIDVIRQIWDTDAAGGVRVEGEHYRVVGAKRGPAPAHDIGLWIGAYKPRMLRLIGELADGWLPSVEYLAGGVAELSDLNARIDEGALAAGRDPKSILRMVNVMSAQLSPTSSGYLQGPASQWVEQLTATALEHGISGFLMGGDDPHTAEVLGNEIAPAVREAVAAARA